MNCKEFEEIINDLACDHLMLANRRVQALTHQEACARCAARLAQERLLTERLQMVAEVEAGQTPARVKASLMAAFAEHQGISAAPVSPAPVKPASVNTPAQGNKNRWPRWAMAAAAAILILLAVVTLRLLKAQSSAEIQPDAPPIQAEVDKEKKESAPQNPTPATPDAPENQKPSIVAGQSKLDGTKEKASPSQGVGQVAQNRKPRNVGSASIAANRAAQNEEVSDYIALTYLNDSTAFDSGLVVRVQVPRSTLISMGLPMSVENSSELVKADVVVGDDGVARAIRLVHDLSTKADGK
jgi:hypothetical protein